MIPSHLKNTMTVMNGVKQCYKRKKGHKYFTFQVVIIPLVNMKKENKIKLNFFKKIQ